MLNIQFRHDSAPVTDAEVLAIVAGIRPAMVDPQSPDRDMALLLAKLVFRIEMQNSVALTPRPFAHFQWNSGWNSWEEVVPSAAGQEGVITALTLLSPAEINRIKNASVVVDAADAEGGAA